MAHARLSRASAAALALVVTGCGHAVPPGSKPIPQVLEQVSEAGLRKAGDLIERHLKEQETFGYVAPFAPVVLPPEIRRVWVPTHVGEDGNLVAGHWVYLRLRDWRWFIEEEAAPLRLGGTPTAVPIAPLARPSLPTGPRTAPGAAAPLPWVEGTQPSEANSPAPAGAGAVPALEVPPLTPGAPTQPTFPSPPSGALAPERARP